MAEIEVHLSVNHLPRTVKIEPCSTLLELLREKLGLTGTKEACGAGDCGACIVVLDGQAVNSCLVLAAQTEGSEVITVEGLAKDGVLHPLQQEFAEKWALQCGFCTPGMLMSCFALLLKDPHPSPEAIREAISGNLCRCGTYQSVVEAVQAVAESNKVQR
jgi:aerobic carbon-monoxide dehydrogenase small subunit